MKILTIPALLTTALLSFPAPAADSGNRTTMPDKCSERDVNCTINDGPPRRATAAQPQDKDKDKRGNTPPGTDRSGGTPASGAIVDPSGVTRK